MLTIVWFMYQEVPVCYSRRNVFPLSSVLVVVISNVFCFVFNFVQPVSGGVYLNVLRTCHFFILLEIKLVVGSL